MRRGPVAGATRTRPPRARRGAGGAGRRASGGKWWEPYVQPRAVIVTGVVLTYIWRWHDIHPILTALPLLAGFTALAWLTLIFSPRMPDVRASVGNPVIVGWLLFTCVIVLSIPTAVFQGWSQGFFMSTHTKTIAMVFLLLGFLHSLDNIRLLFTAHVLGAAAVSFFYARAGFSHDYTPISMHDPNDLGLMLAMVVPMAVFLVLRARSRMAAMVSWGALGMIGLATLGSQSRGAFLALGCASLVVAVRTDRIPPRIRLALPLLVVVSLFLIPAEARDRLSTLTNLEEDYNLDSEGGRVQIWKRGLTYIEQRPVLGWGVNSFGRVDLYFAPAELRELPGWRGKTAHNSLIQVTVETGLIGGFLFASLIVLALVRLVRLKAKLRRWDHLEEARDMALVADLLVGTLVAYIVGGTFLSQGYSEMLVSVFTVVAGLEACASRVMRPGGQPLVATKSSKRFHSRIQTSVVNSRSAVRRASAPS